MNVFAEIVQGCIEDPMQAIYIALLVYAIYFTCITICPRRDGNNI